MAQGSGGYGTGGFSQVSRDLGNIAFQFTSILSLQLQINASLTAWRNLEKELVLAQAAANGTRGQFIQLEQAARNFALASTFSAGQVANTFYNLASAGLSVKQSLQAATGVLLLAQATLVDLGEASDLTASTMAQFNLEAGESYRVSNLFVAATNNSLATVNKLAFALRQVGPIAAQSNLSLEQTVGILDKLFDAGLRGEQAGTALRNILSRLSDPVGAGAKVLENYGIKQIDENGEIKDRIALLKELAAVRPSQSALTSIVGIEGAAGMTIVLKQLREQARGTTTELEKHIAAITNTDAAYRQAALQMQTLDGSMSLMSNNFTELQIIAGQQLAPAVYYVASALGNFVDKVRELTQAEIIGYVQTGLTIVSFLALGKSIGSLGGALTGITRGFTALREARVDLALLRGAAGATTFAEKMALAGSSLSGFATGFAGLASGVLVIGTVIAAAAGLAKAWDEAAKAKERAETKGAFKMALAAGAESRGATDDQIEQLSNVTELGDALNKQFSNLNRQFKVDKGGNGAFQKMRALRDTIAAARQQFNLTAEQAKNFRDDFLKNRDKFRNLAKDLESFDGDSSGIVASLARNITTTSGVGLKFAPARDGGLSDVTGEEYAARVAEGLGGSPKSLAVSIADNLTKISQTPLGPEFGRAVQNYRQTVLKSITDNKFLGASDKSEAITRTTKFFDTLRSDNVIVQNAFREGAKKALVPLTEAIDGGDIGAGDIGKAQKTLIDTISGALNRTDAQLEAEFNRIIADKDRVRAVIAKAQSQVAALGEPIKKELLSFIVDASDVGVNSPEAQQIFAFANSKAGQDALKAADQAIQNGASQRDAIQIVIDAMKATKKFSQQFITQQTEAYLALPLLDAAKIRKWSVQARLQQLKALMSLAELGKSPDKRSVAQLAAEIRQTEASEGGQDVIGTLFERLMEDANQKDKNDLQAFQAAFGSQVPAALRDIGRLTGDAKRARINQAVDFFKRHDIFVNANTYDLIALAAQEYQNSTVLNPAVEEAKFNERQQKEGNKGLRTDPSAKYIADLLGLPTKEELFLQSQQLLTQSKYAVADYFNLPLAAIGREFEEAQVDFRSKLVDFQKKFRDTYTNTLAKGVEGAVASAPLSDAFSGVLIKQIIDNGEADVFGKKVTKAMLQSSAGIETFINAIEAEFASAVAGSEGAETRVAQADVQLRGMVTQTLLTYQNFSKGLDVVALKREEVARQAREFFEEFDQQKLIDLFQQQAQGAGSTDAGVDISIDVAINARTAQITLDTQSAIKQMREKYIEAFKQLNVPVQVTADGKFRPVSDNVIGSAGASAVRNVTVPPSVVADTAKQLGQGVANYLKLPSGRVTGRFGEDRGDHKHAGIDIALPVGTPLRTAAAGKVIQAGPRGAYGNAVEVAVGGGLSVLYGHLSKVMVKAGQQITADQLVGLSGNTGRSSGPHGHIETRIGGKAVDPSRFKSLGGGAYEVAGGANGGRDKTVVTLDPASAAAVGVAVGSNIDDKGAANSVRTQEGGQPIEPGEFKPSAEQLATRDRLIEEYNKWLTSQLEIMRKRIEYVDANKAIFAEKDIAKASGDLYDQTEGEKSTAYRERAERSQAIAEARIAAARGNIFTQGVDKQNSGALRAAIVARNIASIEAERIDTLDKLNRTTQIQIDLVKGQPDSESKINELKAEQLRIQEAINNAAREETALAPNRLSAAREARDTALQAMESRSDARGGYTGQDAFEGIRAGAITATKDVQSFYELTRDASSTAIGGMVDALGILASGVEGSKKKALAALADMAAAVSRMIIQMLILKAIQSVVGLAGGGTDAPSQGAGVNNIAKFLEFGGIMKYAYGGMQMIAAANGYASAQQMDKSALTRGGIRGAKNPAIALFGEGHHPEAYIPMVDKRSIPVHVNDNGDAVVPLPSGQQIPVTLTVDAKKFANGGSDNVIRWNPQRARNADRVGTKQKEAVNRGRGSGPGGMSIHMGDKSYSISVPVTIQGNATGEDGDMIAAKAVEKIMQMMDAREAESARQSIRARRGMAASEWGLGRGNA